MKANAEALKEGLRLLSAYHLSDGTKIWIITEWDRSASTVLVVGGVLKTSRRSNCQQKVKKTEPSFQQTAPWLHPFTLLRPTRRQQR
jgi:hypothetical protein